MSSTVDRERADLPTVELEIGGMTCATCATRIERKLNRIDGVVASVNYATATAHLRLAAPVRLPELVSTVESLGYTAAPTGRGAVPERFGLRAVVSAGLAAVVLALAMIGPLQFLGWAWVSLAVTAIVVGWGGWPFHRAAALGLRHGTATMDTLISLGALVSFLWSAGVVLGRWPGELYFEVGATLVAFLLLGRWFEARAKHRAGSALRALVELGAKEANRLGPDGIEERVPASALRVGDQFVVRPGEKVATDGVVIDGASAVDVSLLTGESQPIEVGPGDSVLGATVNADGRLLIRAIRVGEETSLAQLARLVLRAQSGKAPVQRLADRVSAVFVPFVLVAAAVTFAGWLLAGSGAGSAFATAVAVLIVACPCALGLATPTALLAGTGRGAQLGLLIRGPEVLESTRRIDTVLLDKTGTVTTGAMRVVDVRPAPGVSRAELLRLAGAVEHASEHPVARAIAAAGRADGALPSVADFQSLPGLGAQGRVDGHDVVVGQAQLLVARGVAVPLTPSDRATAVEVAWDGQWRGTVMVADPVKPTSAAAVARLRGLGLRPLLLTGDSVAVARSVAAATGIDDVVAQVSPADKVETVRRLQAAGHVVAMVGDGVNDAAALAAADLGIAMGTGTDVAIEASDLTIIRSGGGAADGVDLGAAADAVALSRATLRVIRANLAWAFGYNLAAIPLAAAGFVSPVLAGAAMALSSVAVVANSLRLFRFGRRGG